MSQKEIDERSVFKFVFAALATFLVIYTYIIQLSHISLSLSLSLSLSFFLLHIAHIFHVDVAG